MDERMKELVAIGAAAAANCHPCMDHHLAKCDELGVSREEVAEAVKVGLMVNHGAERAIRRKARELLGESMVEAAQAQGDTTADCRSGKMARAVPMPM